MRPGPVCEIPPLWSLPLISSIDARAAAPGLTDAGA